MGEKMKKTLKKKKHVENGCVLKVEVKNLNLKNSCQSNHTPVASLNISHQLPPLICEFRETYQRQNR